MQNENQLDFFIATLLRLQTRAEMAEFLWGILTPQELEEIPRRLEIVKRLKQGIPHHRVAKELHIGVATVTRGSKELQKGRFHTL